MIPLAEQEKFISNVAKYAVLSDERIPVGLRKKNTIAELRRRASECRRIMTENDLFISRYLSEKFISSDSVSEMTPTDAEDLFSFARKLYMPVWYPGDPGGKDCFLTIEVYRVCADYALKHNDILREIICIYAIALQYNCIKQISFQQRPLIMIENIMKRVKYSDIPEHEWEARRTYAAMYDLAAIFSANVFRCSPVLIPYTDVFEAVRRAELFYSDNFSSNSFFDFSYHVRSLTNVKHQLCSVLEFGADGYVFSEAQKEEMHRNIFGCFKGHQRQCLSSFDSDKILSVFGESNGDPYFESTIAFYIITSYHNNHINTKTYLSIILALVEYSVTLKNDGKSEYFMLYRIQNTVELCGILGKYYKDVGEHHKSKFRATAKKVFIWLRNFKKEMLAFIGNMCDQLRLIANMVTDSRNIFAHGNLMHPAKKEYIEIVLMSTTHNHLPTYVHCVMVSRIMCALANYFIKNDPAKFIGISGAKSVADVENKLNGVILGKIELAGLAHDIGKISYIEVVSRVSRKLLIEEYDLIHEHPNCGCRFFMDDLEYQCITDVIRGHHKRYDRSDNEGYPEDFDSKSSPYSFIINICTVADAIDAATDDIGRSYQLTKSPDMIMNEIISLSAKGYYSPSVAGALKSEELRRDIREILSEERPEAYYNACLKFYDFKI